MRSESFAALALGYRSAAPLGRWLVAQHLERITEQFFKDHHEVCFQVARSVRAGQIEVQTLFLNKAEMEALQVHLDRAHEMKRDEWVWGFSEWGKEMLVFVACTAARRAESALSGDFQDEPGSPFQDISYVLQLLDACEAWLSIPGEEQLRDIHRELGTASSHCEKLDFWGYEIGGRAEERALDAVLASMEVGWAILWKPEHADRERWEFNGDAEREARRKTGPALEVVKAVSHACYALDWRDAEMKAFLAAEIRTSPFLQPAVSETDFSGSDSDMS